MIGPDTYLFRRYGRNLLYRVVRIERVRPPAPPGTCVAVVLRVKPDLKHHEIVSFGQEQNLIMRSRADWPLGCQPITEEQIFQRGY